MPCGCGPNSCHDFDDDREGVAEEDLARFGGDDVTCPKCGTSIFHDVALCPRCGHAVMDNDLDKPAKINLPVVAGLTLVAIALAYFVWLR